MVALQIYPKLGALSSGGTQVFKRNRACLEHFFGKDNVLEYAIFRKVRRVSWKNITGPLFGLNFCGLDNNDREIILDIITQKKVNLVFLETSLFGILAKFVKKNCPQVKVVSFFHNVEYDFQSSQQNFKKRMMLGWLIPLVRKSEALTLCYADTCVTLHHRDNERLYSLYGKYADYEVPVTLKDTTVLESHAQDYHSPLCLLFFGSNFPSNVEAVDFLVNKIMPKVNAVLRIAGSGMDVLKDRYVDGRITVEGYVENLAKMYEWADVVVLPIFTGAGMKVKVAEALQYGKNVLASTDALTGYDTDGIEGIISCNNVDDFVNSINNFDTNLPRYNKHARNLFENRYSYQASFKIYDLIFENTMK